MAIFKRRYVIEGSGEFPMDFMAQEGVVFASTEDEAAALLTGTLRRIVLVRDTRFNVIKPQGWRQLGWELVRDLQTQPITSREDAESLRTVTPV